MPKTKKNIKLSEEMIRIGKDNGFDIVTEERGGGSDANHIAFSKIPVVDGFGPQGKGDHTTREFVYLDSIEPSIELSVATIIKLQK